MLSDQISSPNSDSISLGTLKDVTKRLYGWLEPVDHWLSKTGESALAQKYFEQDIRAVIIRLGFHSSGRISDQAANLYLELFSCLHPTIFRSLTVDVILNYLQDLAKADNEGYVGRPTRPHTLELVENYDAANGTDLAKSICMLLLMIAVFAAQADGKMSKAKESEVVRLREVMGWRVVDGVGRVSPPRG